jgi:hypothetical protein
LIERRKSNEGESAVAGSTSSNWIAWAKEHVDALDPFRHGVADPTAAGLNAHWAFNDLEDGGWALQNRLTSVASSISSEQPSTVGYPMVWE